MLSDLLLSILRVVNNYCSVCETEIAKQLVFNFFLFRSGFPVPRKEIFLI